MAVRKRTYRTRNRVEFIWGYQFQRDKRTFLESGFGSYKDAAAAEEAKKRELTFDERHTVEVRKCSLRDILPLYIGHRRATRSQGTASREERFGRQISAQFGDRLLTDISTADIHAFVAQRKRDGLANRSVNLELNTLRCIFRFAVECGYVRQSPAKDVKMLREPRLDHWIPSPEELERFVAEAEKTYSGKVLSTWIRFMAYTGMRPREALFIEWNDIDFDRQQIVIKPKPGNPLKSGKARYVELHDKLKTILLEWREEWKLTFEVRAARHPDEKTPPHDWVFYNPRKQVERVDSFNTCFETVRRRSSLPKLTPYTLRHFFVSYCVMNGIDFLTISRWVGHSSTHMIEQVYGHLTPGYRASQMGKFNIAPKQTEQPVAVPV
jgi:integrase